MSDWAPNSPTERLEAIAKIYRDADELASKMFTMPEMRLIERVAAAMYVLPDANDPDAPIAPWPPTHPDDHAWWMAHAKAAINAMPSLEDTVLALDYNELCSLSGLAQSELGRRNMQARAANGEDGGGW